MIWQTLKWLVTPQHRPFAEARPARRARDVPLGMEALDLRSVEAVNRRNHALDRTHNPAASWLGTSAGGSRRIGALENADTSAIIEFDDDETYAARFHAAFKSKDKTQ